LGVPKALLKRSDGQGFVFKGGEEIQQANHFEGLQGEFGGFQEANGAAGLLGGREMTDEHTDAAGIDGGDAFKVQDDFGLALDEEFVHGRIEAVERRAHAEATCESDNLDAVQSSRVDIQERNPSGQPGDCRIDTLSMALLECADNLDNLGTKIKVSSGLVVSPR
jgi:hypothetical protein